MKRVNEVGEVDGEIAEEAAVVETHDANERSMAVEDEEFFAPSTSAGRAEVANVQAIQGVATALQAAAAAGFEGLELDYTSFLTIKNPGKLIETSEQHEGITEFFFRPMGSKAKWCFRSNHAAQNEVEVVYSYDKAANRDLKSPVAEKIAEWRAKGYDLHKDGPQQYLEVQGVMLKAPSHPDLEGRLINVQVAKASIGGVSAALMRAAQKSEPVIRARLGALVTTGDFPFKRWEFVVLGAFED